MARPCCEAKTQLPRLHDALVARPGVAGADITAEHLRWFFNIMCLVIDTAELDDAHTISRIGDRHDIGDSHLTMFTGMLADWLDALEASGKRLY